jgi:heme-degrading monooxygenase HmoA
MRIKPGAEEELMRVSREDTAQIDGFAFEHVFRSDSDPLEFWLVVGFESKEAYQANAASPEQHQRYVRYRDMMTADPEWHDGEIVQSLPD